MNFLDDNLIKNLFVVCVSADMAGSSITGKLTVGGRTIFEKSLSGCMIDTF